METKEEIDCLKVKRTINGKLSICAWKKMIANDDKKRENPNGTEVPTLDINHRCALCFGYNKFCPAYESIRTPNSVPMYPVHLTKQIVENIIPFYEKHGNNEVFLKQRLDAGGGYNH